MTTNPGLGRAGVGVQETTALEPTALKPARTAGGHPLAT